MDGRVWLTLLLAVVVTGANAAKPPVVDDTAYLFFARHLAEHLLEPYAFDLFWYAEPQPAMQILLPPLLPYWLAAGIRLFGEQPVLLKLWLFPFAWLLTAAIGSLLRRFAPGQATTGLILFASSPVVLPLFNFMLDLPALALALAGVAVFLRAVDVNRLSLAILAGLLVGLAMQTKYSMLLMPLVLLWAWARTPGTGNASDPVKSATPTLTLWVPIAAVLTAAAVFVGWEWFVFGRHGESHFLYQLHVEAGTGDVWASLNLKTQITLSNVGPFGALTLGAGLWLMEVIASRRSLTVIVAALIVATLGVIAVVPAWHPRFELAAFAFPVFALLTLSLLVAGLVRDGKLLLTPALTFLLGWLAIEAVGCVLLSPFPACRRTVGLGTVTWLLVAAVVASLPAAPRPRWPVWLAVAYGLSVAVLDLWDAYPEPVLAERAAAIAVPAEGETVWFNGHWGFQYACDRAGMQPVVPGRSELKPGDWLIFPQVPDPDGFYRPYHGGAKFKVDTSRVTKVEELVWDDPIAAQSLPHFYGGDVPIRSRTHPRLKVVVYRATAPWAPGE